MEKKSLLINNENHFLNEYSKIAVNLFNPNEQLNLPRLYINTYNCIPSEISESCLDIKMAMDWFIKEYKDIIIHTNYLKFSTKHKPTIGWEKYIYLLSNKSIISFDNNHDSIRILFDAKASKFAEKLALTFSSRFRNAVEEQKNKIHLLIHSDIGLRSQSWTIKNPALKLEENYNDDFIPIHETIVNRLLKNDDKGVILLHGKPGTGKTNYIRHIIPMLDKDVVFIPPHLAPCLTDPTFMELLLKFKNTILVVEDAEQVILDRQSHGRSAVSTILNLADGLLADALAIQMILTFNVDIHKVDKALLRKGRLIAKYEFKELEISKAQFLSNKLGFKTNIKKAMTLAEIYEQEKMDFECKVDSNLIGFKKIAH